MARIDLTKYSAVSLEVHADFPLEDDLFESGFGERLRASKGRFPLVYFTSYSRHKVAHSVSLIFGLIEQTQQYHFHLFYYLPEGDPAPVQLPPISEALTALGKSARPATMAVSASFDYPVERYASILRFPIRFNPLKSTLYDEIQGMRLVKLAEEGRPQYSIVVDQPTDSDTIHHNVKFSFEQKISEQGIEQAFATAVDLSNRFVSKNS